MANIVSDLKVKAVVRVMEVARRAREVNVDFMVGVLEWKQGGV